jgi:hypothetical protein
MEHLRVRQQLAQPLLQIDQARSQIFDLHRNVVRWSPLSEVGELGSSHSEERQYCRMSVLAGNVLQRSQ